jgi:type II secretory pathway component GspD/PulD (secretin)
MKYLLTLLFLPVLLLAEEKGPIYTVEFRILGLPANAIAEAELRQLNARGIQRLLMDKKAQVLAAPKLTQYANTLAEMQIGEDVAYFAPTNSLYDLRYADVGISAAVKVIPADGDVVTLDAHITLTTMTGRKKLPTADLDAGEPLLDKQEIKTVVKAQLGENTFLGSSKTRTATGRQDYLLVIARVTREGK